MGLDPDDVPELPDLKAELSEEEAEEWAREAERMNWPNDLTLQNDFKPNSKRRPR